MEVAVEGKEHPADVWLPSWDVSGPTVVDLTIVHPLQPGGDRNHADRVVEVAEQAKRTKYQDMCDATGIQLVPMGMSTWSGYGPAAVAFMRRLLASLTSPVKPLAAARVKAEIRQRLSFALMEVVAQQLLEVGHVEMPAGPPPHADGGREGAAPRGGQSESRPRTCRTFTTPGRCSRPWSRRRAH